MLKPELVGGVVSVIARQNPFHPVRDYLESLPAWDQVPRIGTWLIDYCGVESSDQTPNHYAEAIGEKFLMGAVARVFEPGCKFDYTLVLEGDQGTYKSTLLRTLAGDWFTDQIADFGSKDASLQLRGVWIIELSELDALNRSEIARVKAFLTQQTERFRVPYGRRLVSVPRQCIFAGTSNSQTWMKDETAGRRFLPINCGSINIPAIKRDRDQLWAEAVKCNRAGTPLWLDSASILRDAEEEQRGRLIEDAWQARIEELLQQRQRHGDRDSQAAAA
jgi:predicted P-loop ATPase